MAWEGGEASTPLATKENARTAQENYLDYHNNYLPLVGDYLDDVTATDTKREQARGIAAADVASAYKGAPNATISEGASSGIGGSSRVTRNISDTLSSKGRDLGIGRNAGDFATRAQELQGRLKMASLGRDLESNINAAANNTANGLVNSSISEMNNNRLSRDAAMSGVSSIAGAATYKYMDGRE